MAQDFSRHHIVPISMGGGNAKHNIVKLLHKYHVAFHQVFNNLPPHQQFERLLNINGTALTGEFKERFLELLDSPKGRTYKEGVFVPKAKALSLPVANNK